MWYFRSNKKIVFTNKKYIETTVTMTLHYWGIFPIMIVNRKLKNVFTSSIYCGSFYFIRFSSDLHESAYKTVFIGGIGCIMQIYMGSMLERTIFQIIIHVQQKSGETIKWTMIRLFLIQNINCKFDIWCIFWLTWPLITWPIVKTNRSQ